ncbi:MAG: TlpA family protein disulfide reductase [Burkholderiales bacterium]|nr:TlpA family protein disulfide reductase [Burkholderiales bacterium]
MRALVLLLALWLAPPAHALGAGDPAPALALPTAGGTVALDALRGKLVYVDFWASWCAPCRRSFPWMGEMQRRYGDRGLVVVAVNVDRRRADAERFLQATPAAFTVAFDDTGRTPTAWEVKGMPSSYLVDPQGRVLLVESGFRDERKDAIEARIREALPVR